MIAPKKVFFSTFLGIYPTMMKYFSKVLKAAAAGHFRISEALSLYIASFGNDHVSHQNDRT